MNRRGSQRVSALPPKRILSPPPTQRSQPNTRKPSSRLEERGALPGRPGHCPAPEHVDMEVADRLSTVLAGVDDRPVTGLGDLLLAGDRGRERQELAEQAGVHCIVE